VSEYSISIVLRDTIHQIFYIKKQFIGQTTTQNRAKVLQIFKNEFLYIIYTVITLEWK